MSDKISISVDDLIKQGDRLFGLADSLEAEKNSFNQNLELMRNSVIGIGEPIAVTISAPASISTCLEEIRFGAQIAKDCAEAFRNADQQNAKDIGNMNDRIIQNGGDNYREQSDSHSDQVITSGKLKVYQGSNKINYGGKDYSGYKVVSGFDPKFIHDQHEYTQFDKKNADGTPFRKQNGKIANEGCTETAEAMAYSMKFPDEPITADQLYVGHKRNDDGTYSSITKHEKSEKKVDGSMEAMGTANAPTVEKKRQVIYEQLNNGNPVVVRLGADRPADGPGHDVVAFGIRDGADPNNLTSNDILCIDPADGKVKTLEECNSKVPTNPYKFEDRGSLRVPVKEKKK